MSGILTAAAGITFSTGSTPASYTDNFNRTENPLSNGGTWTKCSNSGNGTVQTLATLALGVSHSGVDCIYKVNAPSFAVHQKTTVTTGAGIINVSPGVRLHDDGTGYVAYIATSTKIQVYKVPAFTQIGSDFTVTTITAGMTIGLEASGTSTTSLTVYRAGVSQGSVSDSTSPYTDGQPGFHMFDDDVGVTMDQLDATDL